VALSLPPGIVTLVILDHVVLFNEKTPDPDVEVKLTVVFVLQFQGWPREFSDWMAITLETDPMEMVCATVVNPI
jgi:hypothetical protein